MIGNANQTARQFWNEAYSTVLYGDTVSPRGKLTVEVRNVQFKVASHQHLDPREGRSISLDYIRREFLWYMIGDRFDTRIKDYAPIWKSCISYDGGINSNYGQYLFGANTQEFQVALIQLIEDIDSRRCWIPIMQSNHVTEYMSRDIPCHTGFGFRIINNKLEMSVHHRSLDMWWGAPNDFAIAYLWQLLALRYLNNNKYNLSAGYIIHTVESAHFYDRHVEKALETINNTNLLTNNVHANTLLKNGFTRNDLDVLLRYHQDGPVSDTLRWLFSFDGAYGINDPIWNEYVFTR